MVFTIDDLSPLITYEGNWTPNDQGAENYRGNSFTVTWDQYSSATFCFNGTAVTIFGGKNGNYGNFTVALDGISSEHTANSVEEEFGMTLFHQHGLPQEQHKVVLTMTDNDGRGLDIDYVTWTSGNDEQPPMAQAIQDTSDQFTWKGVWETSSQESGTSHWTTLMGSSVNFTFTGSAVSLYGTVGPHHTPSYTVQVDFAPPESFTAQRDIQAKGQTLFHADNLGPGNHSVVVYNGKSTDGRRRTVPRQSLDETGALFVVEYAKVWLTKADLEAISSSTSISTSTSTSSTTSPTNTGGNDIRSTTALSPGAIGGIVVSLTLLVGALLAVIWFLNRKNKHLWTQVNQGYMVQSQFDSHSNSSTPVGAHSPHPPAMDFVGGSASRNMSAVNVNPEANVPADGPSGSPTAQDTDTSVSHSNSLSSVNTKISSGLYTPYNGFGRNRASSKGSATEEMSLNTASSSGGPNPYPDGAYPARRDEAAANGLARGGTIDTMHTVSTLVAEHGSQITSTSDDPSTPKLFPRWSIGGRPNRSSRRRSSRPKSHQRSSSPSGTHLLSTAHESFDGEIYEDDEDNADYYASEARLSNDTPRSPRSTVRTQSDSIRTPTGTRLDSIRTVSVFNTPIEEDRELELAQHAQLNMRYLQQLREESESGHSGHAETSHHDQPDDNGEDGAGTVIEVPRWLTSGTNSVVESPPPAYTSNRASLALGSHGQRTNDTES